MQTDLCYRFIAFGDEFANALQDLRAQTAAQGYQVIVMASLILSLK